MKATIFGIYLITTWLCFGLFIADQLQRKLPPQETVSPSNH